MQIGPYTTNKIIEQYGSATVYSALHEFTRQPVLFTLIKPVTPDAAARWETRLNVVKRLHHPNILDVVDSDHTGDGSLYIVTPRLPTVVALDEVLSPDDVLVLSQQVSAALDYAHEQNLVHGVLKRLHVVKLLNGQSAVRGFELAGDPPNRTVKQDIAALARLIYRALVGQEINPGELFMAGLPPVLTSVLKHALSGSNFKTAGDFHTALTKAVEMLPPDQRHQPLNIALLLRAKAVSGERMPREVNHPRRWLLLAAIFTLILVIGGGVFLVSKRQSPTSDAVLLIPTITQSATPTLPATNTNTVTPTVTPTPTLTATATNSRTPTNTPTATLTATQTLTPSSTPTPTLTRTPTPTSRPTDTAVPTPAPDALVAARAGVVLRVGPGPAYFTITTLKMGIALRIISRTDDGEWLKVRFRNIEGWVAATNLQVFLDLSTITPITADEIARIPTTKACVDIAGDSIAHGGAVFEIPAIGYVRAAMIPMNKYLQKAFGNAGFSDMQAIDRSVSAVGISSNNHPSYLATSEFNQLLNDRCRFTVIMPWINDLSSETDPSIAAQSHIAALISMVKKLVERNSFGRILILNYYQGAPMPFALNGFATGFTPDGINTFNQQLASACSGGPLADFKQVTCVETSAAFTSMGTAYLVGNMTRSQIEAELVSSLTAEEITMLDAFTNVHPNGLLRGDGVHLSANGKIALAGYLVNLMSSLPTIQP